MKPVVHYQPAHWHYATACGLTWFTCEYASTPTRKRVTCKRCLRYLRCSRTGRR